MTDPKKSSSSSDPVTSSLETYKKTVLNHYTNTYHVCILYIHTWYVCVCPVYLGVIIDESLKGDRMMESVMENSRKALYGVNRLIRGLGNVGWETFTKLYMSYVRSSMLYAAEIWGLLCRNEYKLEKVQRAAIRSRLGVHTKFPLLGLELEAGWMPVRWEAKLRRLSTT